MKRVTVLDIEQDDVLVFRTSIPWRMQDVAKVVEMAKDLFGVHVIIVDATVDLEILAADRIAGMRALFGDPNFRRTLTELARALRKVPPGEMMPGGFTEERIPWAGEPEPPTDDWVSARCVIQIDPNHDGTWRTCNAVLGYKSSQAPTRTLCPIHGDVANVEQLKNGDNDE